VKARKSPIKSYYFDILMLAEYWKCFEKSQRIYHHTISTNLLYGLREAIGIFIEQGGLEKSWRKHRLLSRQLYDKLEVNGFKMYIEDVECRCPSVTSVVIPQDINSLAVMSYAMTKYKFEIAGGLGLTAAKIFRIGLMGANANKGLVEKTVKILLEAINESQQKRHLKGKL
jgi:alanine-glyoxylate transaminase / serine-glyoxylate transaminase / serine-pyruvate transaminase